MPIDVKKWLAEKSEQLGLDDSEKAVAEKILSNQTFRGDFVPVSDFHSALSRKDQQFKQQFEEVLDMNTQWQEEYENKFKPALQVVERLRQAGAIGDDGGDGYMQSRQPAFDPRQIDAIVESRVSEIVEPVRATTLDFTTFVADKALEYRDEFGKRFSASEFRKFAYENRNKYPTLDSAYDAYTADDRKDAEQKERDKWKEQEREKIKLELMSSSSFPEAPGGFADGSPLFIANDQKETPTPNESRAAFARTFATVDWSKLST